MKNNTVVLSLDPFFDPFSEKKSSWLRVRKISFPSGFERGIYLEGYGEEVLISTRISHSQDLIDLFMTTDALRRLGVRRIGVFIPYLPYARQDRVINKGEAFSLKVIGNLINSQGYDYVWSYDVHSDVAGAVIDRFESISNALFVSKVLESVGGEGGYRVVSPDAGAYKKVYKLCQDIGHEGEIVACNKRRDTATGNLLGVVCSEADFGGRDLFIVDDICDGGGTFVMLAKELRKRNCGKINLIVSHGIFSKGIEALEGIDHVYTTNTIKDLESNSRLTQIKLSCSILF